MAKLYPWLPLVILLTGVPHYGATLLRISSTPAERQRYAVPAILLSALVLCAFVAGLAVPRLGSWQITAYLSLSPWHYAAQNYGLTMLFLRRNNLPISTPVRRLLRASFITSYLLVLLSYHQKGAGSGSDPLYAASAAFRFVSVGLPVALSRFATPLLFVTSIATLLLALRLLLKKGPPRALVPAGVLLFSQFLWFSLPALVSLLAPGRYPGSRAAFAFVWIALGHCVQYLWIAVYYHRAAGARSSGASTVSYLLRATFVGAALWVVPALLFAPGVLGRVPFEAGLGLLIAAAINLHHFALDSMIWKLRDPRIGALLVDGKTSAADVARRKPAEPPTLLTCALITIGGLATFGWIAATWEREIGHHRAYAAGDLARLEQASERLAALGRDGPEIHVALGKLKLRQGQREAAISEFLRSLRLSPTAEAWIGLGRAHQASGDLDKAQAAYRAALALAPEHAVARRYLEGLNSASRTNSDSSSKSGLRTDSPIQIGF